MEDVYTAGEILDNVASYLERWSYSKGDGEMARVLARTFANSTLPVLLFREFVTRSPEALAAFMDEIDKRRGRTQKSEPAHSAPAEAGEANTKVPGFKGASAESKTVTVTSANAGGLAGRIFSTREVSPRDIEQVINEAPIMHGEAITDANGPVRCKARFANGERVVEFMDKRGPVLLMRVVGSDGIGREIVNGPLSAVEPEWRERIRAIFAGRPGADDEFNFDPFEGMPDPWLPASQNTTVDG